MGRGMSASTRGPGRADVVVCPDGPLLIRGDHVVQAADGSLHETTRPVSAVCRCGTSSIAPWCDGSHRLLDRATGPAPTTPTSKEAP
ncbi:zinc finger CDGSH type [Aeromicrobium marinum DSM 15272]|uniref:Zinc finger CDGSH type n=2 Tax=Aeromicrobium marinum TaxID=219314 RepID=E2S7U8_9ACTN|nr:zinc finger CDGSH type [Aeromicrobium marinum DSM 15272]